MRKYGITDKDFSTNAVKLKKVNINGNICGEFVEFSLSQLYENISESNIDAVYTFPIPDTAVLTGFEATLGGRSLKAAVEDVNDVEKLYEDALENGINLLSMEEDEDGVLRMSIGNILPNETIKIKISYMDHLVYEDNSLKLMIPAVISPRPMEEEPEEVYEIDSYKLSMNLLVESFTKLNITSPTHKIVIEEEDDTLCKVSFDERQILDKDFILILKEEKTQEYGGMVYRYEKDGEEKAILYLRILPRLDTNFEYVPQNYDFLIDMSGSMEGDKLEEAKNALQLCLRNLEDGDRFNIIAFDEKLRFFSKEGKVEINDDNLRKASAWINSLQAGKGANIFEALKYALEEKNNEGISTILLFTDDMVENEDEILDYVKENIGDNRVFPFGIDTSVNSYFINKLAEVGYGKTEFIYPGERIEDMVLRQFNRITNPQVDVLSIDWGAVDVESTYPSTIDYLYDREPFSIFAKVIGVIEGKVCIKGKIGDEDYIKYIDLDKLDLEENASLIQKVWSRNRIESMSEKMRGERGKIKEAMREKIIEISKTSGIISPETTFILIEQIEEPVLGISINKIVPLQMTEEAMKNISEGYFIDSPTFFYKVDITEKMIEEGMDRERAKIAIKYDRENLLRILAKNQFADGAFCNYDEASLYRKLEGTATTLLAFTLGKEDVNIYLKQINKALKFVIKNLNENEKMFDEKLTIITLLALKSCILKGTLKAANVGEVENAIIGIKNLIDRNRYMEIDFVDSPNKSESIRNSAAFMLGLNKEHSLSAEQILRQEESKSIYDIAKLAITKTL